MKNSNNDTSSALHVTST